MEQPSQIIEDKICETAKARTLVTQWKQEGKKIVFTNGVFDLVHRGHVRYLAKAAEEGDKLIIGLNTDSSVKRIKGPTRPINDQESRALLLSAFFFVDAVVYFDEANPLNLIQQLMPDVLIKGADYALENIVGGKEVIENGGQVKTIEFVDGYSSTAIIKKITADNGISS